MKKGGTMNWQYKIIQIIPGRTTEIVQQLNTLGADGWEAIHFANTSVILKRSASAPSNDGTQPDWYQSLPEEISNQLTRVKPTV
jgi:hypothetical protein